MAKRITLLLHLMLTLFISVPSFAGVNWTQTSGPGGGEVDKIIIDPTNTQIVYAVTPFGFYKSSNGGGSWNPVHNGMPENINIFDFAVDPINSQNLYASVSGVVNGGLYKSNDGGETWTLSSTGLPKDNVISITVNPAQTSTIYVNTAGNAIYKSIDSGITWNSANTGMPTIVGTQTVHGDIRIDNINPQIVYAIVLDKLYKSINGGANWTEIPVNLIVSGNSFSVSVMGLTIDAGNHIFAFGTWNWGANVWESADGGTTWAYAAVGGPGRNETAWDRINNITSVTIHPNGTTYMYATSVGGVIRNTGSGWQRASKGLLYNVNTLVVDPQNIQVIYAGTHDGGVYKSTDGGANWGPSTNGISETSVQAIAVVSDNNQVQAIYAGDNFNGISKSSDAGNTWNTLVLPVPQSSDIYGIYPFNGVGVYSIAVDPTNTQHVLIATSIGIMETLDGGLTWSNLNNNTSGLPAGVGCYSVKIANVSQIVYAACNKVYIKTKDIGAMWTVASNGLPLAVSPYDIAVDPNNPLIAYAAYNAYPVYKTTNGGNFWSATSSTEGFSALAIDPSNSQIIYGSTFGGVAKSADGGLRWNIISGSPKNGTTFNSIVVDPVNSLNIYVVDLSNNLKESNDGGVTWHQTATRTPMWNSWNSSPTSVTIDPIDPTNLYVGTSLSGVIRGKTTRTLTITLSGTGQGTVTPDSGTLFWNQQTGTYDYNTNKQIILTATATTGSTFTGWSGACSGTGTCSVTLSAAANVTANFTANPNTGVCGSSNGTSVITVPVSNLCSVGSASTVNGTGPWSWSCAGTFGGGSASCSAALQTYMVAFTTDGNGNISGTGNQAVNYNTATSSVTAVPASGYHFVNWTGTGGFVTTTTNPLVISNVTTAMNVTANFALNPVNGVCGSSSGVSLSIVPVANLCTAGTPSMVTGTGPWNWTCNGANSGTSASCSATYLAPPPQFTVSPTTGSNYTITPSTAQSVVNNNTTTFIVTPASGYGVVVSGCGGNLNGNIYTTGAVTASCSITVTAVARTASTTATIPTLNDALTVLQASAGVRTLSAVDKIRYDVAPLNNSGQPAGNGTIDLADVIIILRRSINIGTW